ncbi:hypothetical protein DUNSADRAFT_12599 [Dunaliella salina]|uniref:Uncharacterized protein n=1 Tax=Dunaliella salina TaxID=3046 RepID=A0ABQ7GAY3_DUNSA|nr:hypothetical protein DUNSADRAFT_12599 [Dunaliella salina]|eukprot:KAF5831761.1 hypothetical protein DUNSADRAFT_12599 [Dunaliella salina]
MRLVPPLENLLENVSHINESCWTVFPVVDLNIQLIVAPLNIHTYLQIHSKSSSAQWRQAIKNQGIRHNKAFCHMDGKMQFEALDQKYPIARQCQKDLPLCTDKMP